MTDNTAAPPPQTELTQRKVAKEGAEEEGGNEAKDEKQEQAKEEKAAAAAAKPKTRQDFDASWKYYWYMFRYYHFKVADTIDLYASAACLWVINLYLRLFMGVGPEPPSALTEE